jgi:pyrroloquinoline quinone (PQQ) biosynthesis protein C
LQTQPLDVCMDRPELIALQQQIAPLRHQLASHPLYLSMQTMEDVQLFMQMHVFAVWDFMSLLKALQRRLTSLDVPWLPSADPTSRRFINEIVLGEESDTYGDRTLSHFELYLEAMSECGADRRAITGLLAALSAGKPLDHALDTTSIPFAAAHFVAETFRTIRSGEIHVVAAAFTFGREDLIPEMFRGLIRDLNSRFSGQLRTFVYYLERHVEVDGEDHGPMALHMITHLCQQDATRWREATHAAVAALRTRLQLWDAIHAAIQQHRKTTVTA